MLNLQVAGATCTDDGPSGALGRLTAERLGAVWPYVQPKLLRLLEKRGLTKSQAEDVCQDVAVRALASGVEFQSAEDLYRWAGQVARNLHIDLLRSVSRIACDDSVLVDMQCETDVEHEVERRIALAKVLKQWLTLRPLDQAALLEGMYTDGNEERGEAVKLAVRRHRARQRLRLLVDGTFGLGAITACLRRLKALSGTAPVATLVAAPVAFVIAAGPVFGPPPADDAPRNVPVPAREPARLVLVQNRTEEPRRTPARPAAVRPRRPAAPHAEPRVTDPAPPAAPVGRTLSTGTVDRSEEPADKTRSCAWLKPIDVEACVEVADPHDD